MARIVARTPMEPTKFMIDGKEQSALLRRLAQADAR